MEAGRLRQRVTIQYKVIVKDSYGQETITWTELATAWASVEPLTGREFLEGRQETAEVDTRIRIRYRSGIGPEMRAVHGGTNYNILAVLHVEEREREIQLMCRRIEEPVTISVPTGEYRLDFSLTGNSMYVPAV